MESELLDLSVVIVTWNVREMLRECLDALLEEPLHDWAEVIVVDNASSDDTADMVTNRYPGVRLIRSAENLGYSRGNNLAIPECRGRYVMLLNPDTVARPSALRALVGFMDRHPRCGIVAPRQVDAAGRIQYEAAVNFPTHWNVFSDLAGLARLFPRSRVFNARKLGHWHHEDDRDVPAVAGSAMLIRREALREVGLLDETMFYCEDLDLCLRARRAGWTVHYLGSVSIVHYGGASTKRWEAEGRRWQIGYHSLWLYQRKHGPPGSPAALSLFVLLYSLVMWPLASAAGFVLGRGTSLASGVARRRAIARHLLQWSCADKRRFRHHLATGLDEERA